MGDDRKAHVSEFPPVSSGESSGIAVRQRKESGGALRTADLALEAKRLPSYNLQLLVVRGADLGIVYKSTLPHLTIGTSKSCDFILHDKSISRHHCVIYVRDSSYIIRDQDSRNGVFIKGLRIIEAAIDPKTVITIGKTALLFEPKCDDILVFPHDEEEFCGMRGRSRVMKEVFGIISEMAPTNLTCLLVGETGTGKELAAKALHVNSKRADKPFLVVDCAAVGRQFLEDKLFGHTPGAYTGADRARPGIFEEANGGTVFLDEIGELPLELQPKLLRVLERREVTRIGSHRATRLDVRIIAATHRDLLEMVREGAFRKDLFYRLAELSIIIPPLRERVDDIELIVNGILQEEGESGHRLSRDGLDYLKRLDWPGNVRELRNLIRRASAFTKTGVIDANLLDELMGNYSVTIVTQMPNADPDETPGVARLVGSELPLNEATECYRSEYVKYLRERFGNDLGRAADHAGLHPKSISRLFKQYGVYES